MIDLAFAYQPELGCWDIVLNPGQPDPLLVEGTDEIDQRLRCRLRLFKGEWFLDRTMGIPYYEQIFLKMPDPNIVAQIFRTEVLDEPDVLEVTESSVILDKASRVLTVKLRARTTDGTVIIEQEAK